MKKHYTKPALTLLPLPTTGILAGSPEDTNGLTGNVDGTDKVIENGGKDETEEGMSGDAKLYKFVPWTEYED